MRYDEVQPWTAALVAGVPSLDGIPVVLDDGDFTRSAEYEAALAPKTTGPSGVCITVMKPETVGLVEQMPVKGVLLLKVIVPVVVDENVSLNRGTGGFNKTAEYVVHELMVNLVGKGDSNWAPEGRLHLSSTPIMNVGKYEGIWRVVLMLQIHLPVTPQG